MSLGHTLHVTLDPLAGMVVVLAAPVGEDAAGDVTVRSLVPGAARDLLSRGAVLAVVTRDRLVRDEVERNATLHEVDPPVAWSADPLDPETWARLYPHIEQRLGPVDAVLADPAAIDIVEEVFRPDMKRRGHGAIVGLSGPADPVDQLRRHLQRRP